MAIYAIGDVQGCYDELSRLLDQLKPDTRTDELWFVGDLVNRGPRSLEVLRLVKSLGRAAVVTLGNHDLRLIAAAYGNEKRAAEPALKCVLEAPDRDELIEWLRRRSLLHYRPDLNTLMVHAGVPPAWDPLTAVKRAREVEAELGGKRIREFLRGLYGNKPDRWSADLSGADRLRYIVNGFTRMRYLDEDGRLDLEHSDPPGRRPDGLTPWFDLPDRGAQAVRIVFGHWASLGFLQRANLLAIDTGCVWGRALSAVRLDGPARVWTIPAIRPPPAP
ncbi:MAG: symmetrical bis(5'-nucleosyl)-tetraphosphatase [Gammaproteobacteria bacterium]|nr:symmetrical bis(5'-nucleosyl)-tetraphosphatase [Gammaproteobacteria bacterium]